MHGTLLDPERAEPWWRPAGPGEAPGFPESLESALAERGVTGTVWRPVLAAGASVEDFEWSGRNTHRDRVAAGRSLVSRLESVARASGATPEAPLEVDVVAHSHGGNVVLEAVRRTGRDVAFRWRQLVFLGTPLLSFRPAARAVRLALALAVIAAVLGLAAIATLWPGFLGLGRAEAALLFVAVAIGYRWVFQVLAALADSLWRAAYRPILALRGRAAGQVYGPPPAVLLDRLGGRRVVLVTSHQDEADILLQLSVAPRRLYLELVRGLKGWRRVAEWTLVRPVVEGLVLRLLEMTLERLMLGFSWQRVLLFDYDMADLERGRAYPPEVIERLDVTTELLKVPHAAVHRAVRSVETRGLEGENRRVASLRERLRGAASELFAQLHPRHSEYYRAPSVVARIADVLARPR